MGDWQKHEQIAKLTDQANITQDDIAQLDSRRDKEVGNLLSKLGVQIGGGGLGSVSDERKTDEHDQPEALLHRAAEIASMRCCKNMKRNDHRNNPFSHL